jgi:hypothetical protein
MGIEVGKRRFGATKTRYRAREVPEMCDGGMVYIVSGEDG